MVDFECNGINYVCSLMDRVAKLYINTTEQELAEIVQAYDFIVGSYETLYKLKEVLPKEAKIVYSPYITDSNSVFAVAHFDIRNMLKGESESNNDR